MIPKNRFFAALRIASRGMEAQRRALGAATENIANARTSRTEDGDAYAIKRAVHEVGDDNYRRFGRLLGKAQTELQTTDARHLDGASMRLQRENQDLGPVTEIEEIEDERLEYDPTHPDADEDGYVRYPDVNVAQEMTRMISANRVYEANLTAVKSTKSMIKSTLEI
jgi:flagellar basal-body rod protein FlgC